MPLPQAMAEGHAFVEHKAFAAPAALLLRHAFEVAQDAALEVIDFGKPLRQQIGAGLFAADAACRTSRSSGALRGPDGGRQNP